LSALILLFTERYAKFLEERGLAEERYQAAWDSCRPFNETLQNISLELSPVISLLCLESDPQDLFGFLLKALSQIKADPMDDAQKSLAACLDSCKIRGERSLDQDALYLAGSRGRFT